MNKVTKFSAFKLFYDEFIYKENEKVSYLNIKRQIKKIRELTLKIRKVSKKDLITYNAKLNRYNQRIRTYLYEIKDLENNLYKVYFELYKQKIEITNDTINEMPFIISCSFYEDYKFDNKNYENIENDIFLIPRFTSLEKRNIKLDSKDLEIHEYLIKLLKESEYKNRYHRFIKELLTNIEQKPKKKETHYEFFTRIEPSLNKLKKLSYKLEEKTKNNGEYEIIVNKLYIAYKTKFINWSEEIINYVKKYLDIKYKELKYNKDEILEVSNINHISYEEYLEIKESLINEKNNLDELYNNKKIDIIKLHEKEYKKEFREKLMNDYYNPIYYININEKTKVEDLVERTINLYKISDYLIEILMKKDKFDASHSNIFVRGNDANSQINKIIYKLYNPYDILKKYDNVRKTILEIIDKKNDEEQILYNKLLKDRKFELNYHGPIPTIRIITTKLNEKKKEFIIENFKKEICTLSNEYDTRNYDLTIIASRLNTNEMINIYNLIKYDITDGAISVNHNKLNKNQLFYLKKLQEYITINIKIKLNLEEDLVDICTKYLKDIYVI